MHTPAADKLSPSLSDWIRVTTAAVPPEFAHLLTLTQWRWLIRMRDTKGLSAGFRKLHPRALICHPPTLAAVLLAQKST
jgi:hypothetical protein